jgi:hypothetical protein
MVSNAIIKLFMEELQCDQHFASLRNYYMMHAGHFMELLCDTLIIRVWILLNSNYNASLSLVGEPLVF